MFEQRSGREIGDDTSERKGAIRQSRHIDRRGKLIVAALIGLVAGAMLFARKAEGR